MRGPHFFTKISNKQVSYIISPYLFPIKPDYPLDVMLPGANSI